MPTGTDDTPRGGRVTLRVRVEEEHLKIEIEDTGSRTEIRAKVWGDGTGEPAGWQVNCFDATGTRLTAGRVCCVRLRGAYIGL